MLKATSFFADIYAVFIKLEDLRSAYFYTFSGMITLFACFGWNKLVRMSLGRLFVCSAFGGGLIGGVSLSIATLWIQGIDKALLMLEMGGVIESLYAVAMHFFISFFLGSWAIGALAGGIVYALKKLNSDYPHKAPL